MEKLKRWNKLRWYNGRKSQCGAYVKGSKKCMLKVRYRYNDYCDSEDCPKQKAWNKRTQVK